MRRFWIQMLGLAWQAAAVHAADAPPQWVDFVGAGGSTLDGQPLPAGAVLRAYDSTGVLAGEFVVPDGDYPAGWYGLMPVYRDRPDTPEDEGARPGDYIGLTVNDGAAVPLGPDEPVWTQHGSLRHVEVKACTLES